jgi:hypothetical protein
MENRIQQSARTQNGAWLIILLSIAAGIAALFIPAALIVVPAFWAYLGARTKPAWIALPAVAYAAGAFLLYLPVSAAGMVLASAGTAFALYFLQVRHMSGSYTAMTLAGVFLAGLYISVCMPGVLSGEGAFAAAQAAADEMIGFYKAAFVQSPYANADYAALVNEYLDVFSDAVPTIVVPALCIFSGVMGLSNFLFFRLFCKKRSELSLAPMRAFRFWSLPRSMMLGLFALLIGALVLEWSGWQYAEGLSNTVNVLVGMPLLLQGLCVVDFLLARSAKNKTGARVATYVLVGVLFGIVQMPLMLIGCFEQLFRFRARAQTPRA